MPKKSKTKTKKITTIKNINKNKNTNINNVHVHVEKPKTRKKRASNVKKEIPKPFSSSSSLSQGVSQGLVHQRGLVNNEIQQPTVIQTIQAPPDPRLDKLEKRTKKIKDYLKGKGDTKENPINVNSPGFQDAFETPSGPRNTNSRLISEETITPNMLDFNIATKPKKKSILTMLFSSNKKKVPETDMTKRRDPFKDAVEPQLLQLEYKPKPDKPPATAPDFTQSPTGKKITQELKNLVNEIHAANPNNKMKQGPFKKQISLKLRELGVEQNQTDTYLRDMNRFYKAIYDASHEIQPA